MNESFHLLSAILKLQTMLKKSLWQTVILGCKANVLTTLLTSMFMLRSDI